MYEIFPTSDIRESKEASCESDTIRAKLLRNKARYETSLKIVNEALNALDKNPNIAQILELVRRAS